MAVRKISTPNHARPTALDQVDALQESVKKLERQIYAREAALRTALKAATRALTHYADEVDAGDDFDPKLARWALTVASRSHAASSKAHAQHEDISLAIELLSRALADLDAELRTIDISDEDR